ncbi:hypothetical protein ABZ953_06675 [Streptomyces sp. NPDC046465]|uniref:hypothetical protein n=1 Tax=Streptomyces sp. NPDC046465 TaxID=3155810 RepID=UPI00340BF6B5
MTATPPAPCPVDLITAARARLLAWARDTIIADDPALSARHRRGLAQLDDPDPAVSKAGVDDLSAVLHEATDRAGGQPQHLAGPSIAEPAANDRNWDVEQGDE